MFDQISWICPACKVGIKVPKSSPTSSYLSPRHFIAASTMSGSWPTILLGSLGSRYMTGGRVGSSPTLRVLPASPGYLVATLSGSQAAPAGPAAASASIATVSPTSTTPRLSRIAASVHRQVCTAAPDPVITPRHPAPGVVRGAGLARPG